MERIVIPGEMLCVEEEFIPLDGVYTLNGVIRAYVVGTPIYDTINRRVYVKPLKNPKKLKPGDVVIGSVGRMRDDMATVKIIGYDTTMTFKHTFTGVLHISQVVESRAQNLYEYVKLGDVIKVRVLNSYIPYIVSMKDPKLGVILAFCSKCGSLLAKMGSVLRCTKCGNIESRKLSVDYMFVKGK